ncbi:MAG: hypothetical protein WD942_06910 [Dehalococcoidia bacterium]
MQPFLRPDEQVLEVDLVGLRVRYLDEEETRHIGQSSIAFTNHAVYLQPKSSRDVTRIPYASIIDLRGRPHLAEFGTKTARYLLIETPRPYIDAYESLAFHMKEIELASQTVPVGDGESVLLTLRPVVEDEDPVWIIHATEGVDLSDVRIQRTVEDAIDPDLRTEHPLPDWPTP